MLFRSMLGSCQPEGSVAHSVTQAVSDKTQAMDATRKACLEKIHSLVKAQEEEVVPKPADSMEEVFGACKIYQGKKDVETLPLSSKQMEVLAEFFHQEKPTSLKTYSLVEKSSLLLEKEDADKFFRVPKPNEVLSDYLGILKEERRKSGRKSSGLFSSKLADTTERDAYKIDMAARQGLKFSMYCQ